jgi:hemoglobin-like flavoprotein
MKHLQESLHHILLHGKGELGRTFYAKFFEDCPAACKFFEGVNLDVQANVLVNALHVVVSHGSHRFPATEAYLKILGHRHHRLHIPVDMYPKFFKALLIVLEEFHGDSWNAELAQEWQTAFDLTMQTMIEGHVDGSPAY